MKVYKHINSKLVFFFLFTQPLLPTDSKITPQTQSPDHLTFQAQAHFAPIVAMVFCPRLESTQVFTSSSLHHWELSSPLFTIGIYLLSSPLVIIFSSLHHWNLSSLFTIGNYLLLSSPLKIIFFSVLIIPPQYECGQRRGN